MTIAYLKHKGKMGHFIFVTFLLNATFVASERTNDLNVIPPAQNPGARTNLRYNIVLIAKHGQYNNTAKTNDVGSESFEQRTKEQVVNVNDAKERKSTSARRKTMELDVNKINLQSASIVDPSKPIQKDNHPYDSIPAFANKSQVCELDDTSPIPVLHDGNRTLVIVIGSVRGGEPAWNSLYRHVLDINHADLALIVGRPKIIDSYPGNSTLFQRAKYDWSFEDPEGDWLNEMNDMLNDMLTDFPSLRDIDLEQRRKMLFSLSENGLFGPVEGKMGSAAINLIIRYWLSKKIRELNLIEQYERFLITRSDHFYACQHDLAMLDSDKIWTPSGNDWGGVCDRHYVVSNRMVLQSLDLYPSIFRNPEPYLERLPVLNPEQFVLGAWRESCLFPSAHSYFDRSMFTCGHAGDQTRWKKYSDEVSVGNGETVLLKYVDEYTEAMETCRLIAERK